MVDQPNSAVLMFVAHRAAESRVYEALRGAGYELTMAQCRLAQRLSPVGIRHPHLAQHARVTTHPAGAVAAVWGGGVCGAGGRPPAPARARLVVLTDRGRDLCARGAAETAKVEQEWRNHLGDSAYEQLRHGLLALREITDPYR